MVFIEKRDRNIPKEDINFGISGRAKKRISEIGKENVIDSTLGVLSDDNGKLIVLSSVYDTFLKLSKEDISSYAPISGLKEYKEGIYKALFMDLKLKSKVGISATPGGTGAIRNAISNYTNINDTILIQDWHWGPYNTISEEINRKVETFTTFDKDGKFNLDSFKEKIDLLLKKENRLLIILNTPANNPTGYSIDNSTWEKIVSLLNSYKEKITLVLDIAYIDFSGDEKEVRTFFPILEKLNENILTLFCYSLSKTLTIYGLRAGAIVCMSKDDEALNEFSKAMEFSSRGSWSNSPRAPQVILSKIYSDKSLEEKVLSERKEIRDMLLRRGETFSKEAKKIGLNTVPFSGGFFIAIPYNNSTSLQEELEKEDIFILPIKLGIRVSLAAISEDICKILPKKIKEAIDRLEAK